MFYFMRTKAQSPDALRQYLIDSRADGVKVDEGGTVHSDNEIVLNSVAMKEVTDAEFQKRTNSNEYEPTGNAGVESVFRIAPNEMRKTHARANLPDMFWEFTAMDAQQVLSSTRSRDGKSPHELRTGKRPTVGRRRVIGCKAPLEL